MQEAPENRRRVELAGALSFLGGTWGLLSITVAESLTPGYSVSNEAVSGLGSPYFSGTCSTIPTCVPPVQPASAIFVFSLFLGALLILWWSYLFGKATVHRRFALCVAVTGAANLLIGLSYVPLYLGASTEGVVGAAYDIHVTGALVVFVLVPILMIAAYRFAQGPFGYFSMVFGVVALAAFVLFLTGNNLGLGYGGMERMIIYPIELWQIGFGVYLMRGLGLDSKRLLR
jgi:hypothetical membrane protein